MPTVEEPRNKLDAFDRSCALLSRMTQFSLSVKEKACPEGAWMYLLRSISIRLFTSMKLR